MCIRDRGSFGPLPPDTASTEGEAPRQTLEGGFDSAISRLRRLERCENMPRGQAQVETLEAAALVEPLVGAARAQDSL
eukprot:1340877-Alexandrium_andersonii.AAC.1